MTPAQCQAARALLAWTPEDLARASGLSVITVRNFECDKPTLRSVVILMQRALEGAGVAFDDPARDAPGVHLSIAPG